MPLLSLADFALFVLAASAGAFLRFTCSTLVDHVKLSLYKHAPHIDISPLFPWGLSVVNLLGCFGFGVALALSEHSIAFTSAEKIILFTGFFGSFTTFSTFIFEIYLIWQKKAYIACLSFCTSQIILGTLLTYFGIKLFS